MKRISEVLSIAVVAVLSLSCESERLASDRAGLSSKCVNSADNAEQGMLMVYTSTAENRASLLEENDVLSVEPVFVITSRNAAAIKADGLDRWMEVRFNSAVEVREMAARLAERQDVQRIEFCTSVVREPEDRSSLMQFRPSPVTKATAELPFDDPELYQQWNYINTGNTDLIAGAVAGMDINVADAWRLCTGDASVIVAVVDEGVKTNHPDLSANMWVNEAEMNGKIGQDDDNNGYLDDKYGYNFVKGVATISCANSGDEGHATHVAGTIAAVNNNGLGVSGIAGGDGSGNGVRIMSLQIVMGKQSASSADRAKAYQYAADNGASILQCSFGLDGGNVTSDSAFESAYSAETAALRYFAKNAHSDVLDGGIIVFSSGNESTKMAGYPGALTDCISVTALAVDGLPAWYTNYGPGCNIAAPGGEYYTAKSTSTGQTYSAILSTVPKELYGVDYAYMQGTSMACPHVSGVAALGLSYAKKLGRHFTAEEYATMVLTSVDELDSRFSGTRSYLGDSYSLSQYKYKMGTGAINAWKLLMQIEGTPWAQIVCGEKQELDLSRYFGDNCENMTFLSVTASDADKTAIGLVSDLKISKGKLTIEPTKIGSARLLVKAVAGGTMAGGGDRIGGTVIEKTVSVIVKSSVNENGAWL